MHILRLSDDCHAKLQRLSVICNNLQRRTLPPPQLQQPTSTVGHVYSFTRSPWFSGVWDSENPVDVTSQLGWSERNEMKMKRQQFVHSVRVVGEVHKDLRNASPKMRITTMRTNGRHRGGVKDLDRWCRIREEAPGTLLSAERLESWEGLVVVCPIEGLMQIRWP